MDLALCVMDKHLKPEFYYNYYFNFNYQVDVTSGVNVRHGTDSL